MEQPNPTAILQDMWISYGGSSQSLCDQSSIHQHENEEHCGLSVPKTTGLNPGTSDYQVSKEITALARIRTLSDHHHSASLTEDAVMNRLRNNVVPMNNLSGRADDMWYCEECKYWNNDWLDFCPTCGRGKPSKG
jgi:rubrerythrin